MSDRPSPLPTRSRLAARVAVAGGIVVAIVAVVMFHILMGGYDVAADEPHTAVVRSLLDTVRTRSIEARAKGIIVPADFAAPSRISAGAGLYGEMCAGCHLGPGVERSELSQGLYPQAPELAKGSSLTPAEQFWVIKHGLKLTAMPAWGRTHPDPLIWDMVAFIRTMPRLSAAGYRKAVASAPEDHDAMMSGRSHGHDRQR